MNWVRTIITAIAGLPRSEFTEACFKLISWNQRAKGKKRFPLMGPDDLYEPARTALNTIGFFENPFNELLLTKQLSAIFTDSEEAKEVLSCSILFVKTGRELYSELATILRKNRFRVKNTGIALKSLTYKGFKSILVPFVTSNAETLKRLNLLPEELWGMYLEFRRLSKRFGAFAHDKRLTRTKRSNLLSLPQRVLDCLHEQNQGGEIAQASWQQSAARAA